MHECHPVYSGLWRFSNLAKIHFAHCYFNHKGQQTNSGWNWGRKPIFFPKINVQWVVFDSCPTSLAALWIKCPIQFFDTLSSSHCQSNSLWIALVVVKHLCSNLWYVFSCYEMHQPGIRNIRPGVSTSLTFLVRFSVRTKTPLNLVADLGALGTILPATHLVGNTGTWKDHKHKIFHYKLQLTKYCKTTKQIQFHPHPSSSKRLTSARHPVSFQPCKDCMLGGDWQSQKKYLVHG